MSKMSEFKNARAVLGAVLVVVAVSCPNKPQGEFKSVGRGAPVSPAIPWETWRNPADIEAMPPPEINDYPKGRWLVGPLDGPATGNRLTAFLGAASNGAAPEGIKPLPVD